MESAEKTRFVGGALPPLRSTFSSNKVVRTECSDSFSGLAALFRRQDEHWLGQCWCSQKLPAAICIMYFRG